MLGIGTIVMVPISRKKKLANYFPRDEWDSITLNYTSGTTGDPKGVLYHHRGAHLMCLNNQMVWKMGYHPTYLWTLPMFHCNGWCFPWTIAAVAGVNICIRKINPKEIKIRRKHPASCISILRI